MPITKKPSRTRIRSNLNKFHTEFDERDKFYEEECDTTCQEFETKKAQKRLLEKNKAIKQSFRKRLEGRKHWSELEF